MAKGKPYVLCVDDEKIILVSLKDQLIDFFRANDYEYAFALSGEEALEVIEEIQEDGDELALIISDFIMPRMKGDELLIKVKELAPDAIKILLTGQADLDGVRNAINQAGLYRFIAKPWDASDLLLTVDAGIKSYLQKTQIDLFDAEIKLLNKLNLAGQDISVEYQLETLYQKFARHIAEHTGAQTVVLLIENDNRYRPYEIFVDGSHADSISRLQALAEDLPTFARETLKKAENEANAAPWRLSVPLVDSKDALHRHGYLIIENELSKIPIEPKTRQVVQMLASQAVLSIENARLIAQLDMTIKDVSDSIQYAKRIQFSLLPPLATLRKRFPESFVFYRPKDVVSGDFYWFYEHDEIFYVAVIDCTGHGVPGAFMSILCESRLKQIMLQYEKPAPATILTCLHAEITDSLNSGRSETAMNDGMDMTLYRFDFATKTIQVACAMHATLHVKASAADTFSEIQTDKKPIGHASLNEKVRIFTNIEFPFSKGDCFYLFTDGPVDQFGGGSPARKLGKKRFYDFLLSISAYDMAEQEKRLTEFIDAWKKDEPQLDDILMIGLRASN